MSTCKMRGEHYTVKGVLNNRPHGVECMICGLKGTLEEVRSMPCTPPDTRFNGSCVRSLDMQLTQENQAAADFARKMQEDEDRRSASRLQELELEERELKKLLVLQELEVEEALLAGLLNEKRALQIAETAVAALGKHAGVSAPEEPALLRKQHMQVMSSQGLPPAEPSPFPPTVGNSASAGLPPCASD